MATRPADHASWHSDEDDDDPILAAWLAFLERGLEEQPELIRPFTAAEFAGLDELLEGVEADLGAHLGDDDYVLP